MIRQLNMAVRFDRMGLRRHRNYQRYWRPKTDATVQIKKNTMKNQPNMADHGRFLKIEKTGLSGNQLGRITRTTPKPTKKSPAMTNSGSTT